MIVLLSALLALQPISLEENGVRLEDLLAKVGEESGQALECVPELADDRLVVRWQGTDPAELLTRLADSVEGRWTEIEGGRRLVVDAPRQKARRDAAQKARIESLRASFDKIKLGARYDADTVIGLYKEIDAIDPKLSPQARDRKLAQFNYSFPTSRFQARMAKLIGADELGALADQQQVVYSTHPTKYQRALPAGAMGIIRDYFAERILVEKIRGDRKFEMEEVFQLGELGEDAAFINPPSYADPAVALIKVTRQSYGVSIKLQTYDSEGVELYEQRLVTVTPDFEDVRDVVFNPPMPEIPGVFKPSADAVAWHGLLYPVRTGPTEPTDGVMDTLTGTGEDDLLSYGASELALQAAEALDKNLIAVLGDRASTLLWQLGPTTSLQSVMQSLLLTSRASAKVDGDWLMILPDDPDFTRADRLPREHLHRAVNAALQSRPPEMPLEHTLNLISETDSATLWSPYVRVLAKLVGAGDGGFYGLVGDHWGLEFVSRLDPAQRRMLLREGRIELPLESLPAEAMQRVYSRMERQMPLSDKTHRYYRVINAAEMQSPDIGYGAAADGISKEPTWTLAQPQSFPAKAVIEFARQDAFRQEGGEQGMNSEKMTLYGIAQREAAIRMIQESGQPVPIKHLLYGYEPLAGFLIRLSFGERYEHLQYTYLALQPGRHQAVGFAELDQDMKKKLDGLVEELIKRYKAARSGGGGGQ